VARLKALLRTLKALARDPRIPRPIRWLLVFGLLPIPGPLDEAVLLVAFGLIAVFCRPIYREIKAKAAEPNLLGLSTPLETSIPLGSARETGQSAQVGSASRAEHEASPGS
jgi:hypothetical protein